MLIYGGTMSSVYTVLTIALVLSATTNQRRTSLPKGVGTVGTTGVVAPAMLKVSFCQVYQLVDSQTSVSLYSFKILMRSSFVYCFTVPSSHKSHILRLGRKIYEPSDKSWSE